MNTKPIVLAALGVFSSLLFYGQETSPLDPVTITTSLASERVSQTGRNLIVIKGERFASLPVHSVDELIRYIPGIEVQARGPMGSQSDFILRGGTFQQVLVVVDGVRLNDPNTGHFSSYIPIAPAEIDRIEVLKGSSSAVYGSEAVGGVIHIITKSFAAALNSAKRNAAAQLTLGEHGLFSANAGGFISKQKTSVGGGILTNNTEGQLQRGTRGFVYAHTGSASVAHHFSDRFQVGVRTAYDDRNFSAQNFYTTFTSDTAAERVKTFWNQLQATYKNGKNLMRLQLGYKHLKDRYAFNSAAIPNQTTSELFQALVTDEVKIKDKTVLVSGIQFINKKIESNDRGNHAVKQAAVFTILNHQLSSSFYASPALRLEWNERSGWELVPQVNLSFRATDFQARASAGKTIRDADFTERFNNYNKPFVASGRIGNPDLGAERSFNWEMGADYFATKWLKISATFFQRYQSDVIDYVITPYNEMPRKVNLSPTGSYALAKNISEVNTSGFETDVQLSRQLPNDQQLWASIGFTWLNTDTDNAAPSFYILSHGKYLANFNLQYSGRIFSVGLNGLYKQRTPQSAAVPIAKVSKEYFVMNVKAEAFVWKKMLSVFAQVDNIFDKDYADLLGAQMPGRWIMGGIKFGFK